MVRDLSVLDAVLTGFVCFDYEPKRRLRATILLCVYRAACPGRGERRGLPPPHKPAQKNLETKFGPASQPRWADQKFHPAANSNQPAGKSKQIIFSVKAGGVSVPQVRDLRGVIEREKAEIGVFLCFEEPTKPMKKEAADAGLYKSTDGSIYPRLQILTIQQILDGKQPDYPAHRRDATFKKAPRSRPAPAENLTLPLLPGED